MKNRHDLTKFGIVALAGIAILGWVREPERHGSNGSVEQAAVESLPDYAEMPRTTFAAPSSDEGDVDVEKKSDRGVVPEAKAGRSRAKSPAAVWSVPPARPAQQEVPTSNRVGNSGPAARPVAASQPAPADSGRHETDTRARDSQTAEAENAPYVKMPSRSTTDASADRADRSDDLTVASGSGQPAVRTQQQRSTMRSVAIIAGAAAAGAAIGGATGGGKGAAIGAVTAGTGGYVYDRMTRGTRGSMSPNRTGQSSGQLDPEEDEDRPMQRNAAPLARRFGTPAFN